VPDGKISELPFPLEYWDDFEKLLVALTIDVDGLVEVRRCGTSGQEQDGIDVIGLTRFGHHAHAYQCKNVNQFSESDFARAIAKFADGSRPFSPKRLVIAVATAANRTQLIRKLEDTRTTSPACRPMPDGPRSAPSAREGSRGTTLQPARPARVLAAAPARPPPTSVRLANVAAGVRPGSARAWP
jgi:hypothetical protein